MTRWSSLTALCATLASLPIGAVVAAAPAHACTDSDDPNTLCSNEQAFVSDLASYGITPTRSPKDLAALGWRICGMLVGSPGAGVVDSVYQGGTLSREQSQIIVNIAQNRLC